MSMKGILKIAIPSVAVTYATLQYFDPHQSGKHSAEMRQRLQDENKRIGRAHGCEEIHLTDLDKWISKYPEEAEHWKRLRAKFYEN
ncbi:hypothetical protein LTR47_009942 [Exophiala xenobiotica]|nr:hypothetical protein LTR72_011574 [Exophiala xenobiotica]KAK5224185.1 hypothetical protein LTR47_009942 [Exophiala xenobiotica]KAK5250313.1 hypothetical protein LTS06_004891 [Exophiala xenobiotica]KAK5284263.1 hypothetical protein LTR40_000541 [Exophiala xenobiotica]KAK5285427.1 hypothetical protein LTR14_010963 [Exophiala xenobiotica]